LPRARRAPSRRKGKSVSDWFSVGLQPPVLEIEVPYRSLLPRGVEGLIVAGKAISCTHDALASLRMQQDLENLGGVAALAAALALEAGGRPRDVDVRALQKRLVGLGILPPEILGRRPRTDSGGAPAVREWIARSIPTGRSPTTRGWRCGRCPGSGSRSWRSARRGRRRCRSWKRSSGWPGGPGRCAWRRRWPSWVRRRGRTSWRRKSFVSWPAAPCRCGRPG